MATEHPPEAAPEPEAPRGRGRGLPLTALRWIGGILAALVLVVMAAVAWLHTGSGRQFIVDQISAFAPASGLSVEVGRIEGSVLWSATLHDVRLRDSTDTLFLEVPEIDLNWRPYKFPFSGLDVRHLVLHGGMLHALPELIPGDPDAPTLPDFDIRVDRFVIDDLRVAEGLIGEERVINVRAEALITDGLVYLDTNGRLGGGDAFTALIHAEPDGDNFDINLDYRAPAGGLLAAMVGAEEDLRLRIRGDGTWERWTGALVARQAGEPIAALRFYNRAGNYRIVGQARPGGFVTGMPAAALGELVSLAAVGTLESSVLSGSFALRGEGVNADAEGTIDLADNRFEALQVEAALLDPALFGDGFSLTGARVAALLDGSFSDFTAQHELSVDRLDMGGTILSQVVQRGTLTYDGTRLVLPLDATVGRVVSGNAMVDPRLVNGRLDGTLVLTGNRLLSDNLAIVFSGLSASLALNGDLDSGAYALTGPVRASGLELENLGLVDAQANIRFRIGDAPWRLEADVSGRMPRVTNATLANIAGTNIRFGGAVSLGEGRPIAFRRASLDASKLSLTIDGALEDGRTTLAGAGSHADFGDFTVEAALDGDGPRAELVLANPLPAAGLADVRVALAPIDEGFRIETQGQSTLGPFDGVLDLYSPPEGPTRIVIDRLDVWRTQVTGEIALLDEGAQGTLALAGGGLDGTIDVAPQAGGQAVEVALIANDASFGGTTPIAIRRATIDVTGFFGAESTTVNGNVQAAGITYGTMFIGRVAARAEVVDGAGSFDAQMAGRRGGRFDLRLAGDVASERIAVAVQGSYGGRDIAMPRRAVLVATEDGGWELQRTQLTFGSGFAIAEGRFGGDGPAEGRLSLAEMPLSLIDVAGIELGLGGTVSGIVDVSAEPGGEPAGEVRLMVNDLTRSGLILTSRPIDLALVGRLSPTLVQVRSVLHEDGQTRGRLQGRIAMAGDAPLGERLFAGDLLAQLRYDGPADALWRLAALELLDITGAVRVAADVQGSLVSPQVRGSLAGDSLGVQSPLTGTALSDVEARGRFVGSRLQLTNFAGTAPNGGRVNGSGYVDLSQMTGGRGPRIDLRLAARDADVLDLPTMGATITGPMRIVSDGIGGTIAGRLRIGEARWQLGVASGAEELPNIATRQINLPPDIAPPSAPGAPWRFLIDATAPGVIAVGGMGLDSLWSADVRLRGTTDDPRIGGEARVVPRQGFYSFAGVRFDITRGIIAFDENEPIDPRIDLVAETQTDNLAVAVAIEGSASQPEITFSSTPALPEEELLAQLLFGGSITDLSATDALQLGAAVASLRGGGGMDPINQLRSAIGLDRLRIEPADPALNRGTSVALGKNFGRRFYGEVVTDGRDYNATELEYRVTSWLSLLASINTLGRATIDAEYSRDY